MNADEVEQVIFAWTATLESPEHKRLLRFFLGSIPESLLPYPSEKIQEALNFYIKYYESINEIEKAQPYLNAMTPLMMYVDDLSSITAVYKRLV